MPSAADSNRWQSMPLDFLRQIRHGLQTALENVDGRRPAKLHVFVRKIGAVASVGSSGPPLPPWDLILTPY